MSGGSSRNIVKIESILFQEVATMNHLLLRETLASREETPVMRSTVRVVDLTHTKTLERASIMETPGLASTEAMLEMVDMGETVRVDGQTLIITMTAASMVTRARGAGVGGNRLGSWRRRSSSEIVMLKLRYGKQSDYKLE